MVSCAVLMAVAGMAMLGSSTTSAFTSPAIIRSQHSRAAARPSCDHAARTQAPSRHPVAAKAGGRRYASQLRMSTAEETPAAAAAVAREPTRDIPTTLPSECGIDYVPLATMLATGDLKGADQFTRDALIKAAGAGSQKRDFVYWTEVKNIPNTDLATMENLWLSYSKGKFGYSVQKDLWRKTKGDFENFCRRIGWTTMDAEVQAPTEKQKQTARQQVRG
ncbi:tetrapyrrole-binding protein [Ectocarpus siliculosus]|uniref:Tetrapyrrole-binding protein n=1 Tax=Ectocarpus siliculosus TaxID=2880 RepID=D7FZN6_ECTSI|nr:tetrapyrrole-binding protein [Ectocarpus siliculosus]|eukprot:CBJ32843.1 tetrapyrrole-binding protein [Ectocarpus siliculosus]